MVSPNEVVRPVSRFAGANWHGDWRASEAMERPRNLNISDANPHHSLSNLIPDATRTALLPKAGRPIVSHNPVNGGVPLRRLLAYQYEQPALPCSFDDLPNDSSPHWRGQRQVGGQVTLSFFNLRCDRFGTGGTK